MSNSRKTVSPIWLLSFVLLFSATSCPQNPIKYTNQAVQFSPDTEILFAETDSIKTDLPLVIWPKYIRPNREIIISFFLEYGTTRQFILRDTTRYHPDMINKKTKKSITINSPLEVRISTGYGVLTYSLRYTNPKTGAYREAFEPYNWPETQPQARPVIAKVFTDSTSYLNLKNTNQPPS
ncbi:MAG: hypothetical protein HEP71_08000 [Roseivirga sp.]|nr:hypothetical protein [Roseivirga sp.]